MMARIAATLFAILYCRFCSAQPVAVEIKFLNTETGYALPPDRASIRCGTSPRQMLTITSTGRASTSLTAKSCEINIEQFNPDPRVGKNVTTVTAILDTAQTTNFVFWLLSFNPAQELAPTLVRNLLSPGKATLIGFVVDDETSIPIPSVSVAVRGASGRTTTNDRGFFSLQSTLQKDGPVRLVFNAAGYAEQALEHVELVPNVAAIHKVRLRRPNVTAPPEPVRRPEEVSAPNYSWVAGKLDLPNTMRVGVGCNAAKCAAMYYLDLEDYVRRVLAAEWPASALASNAVEALKAGAIAIRSYALAYSRALYICSNTYCQVLNGRTYKEVDAAVQQTKGIVLADDKKVATTEYAAETNNFGCGDGFTGEVFRERKTSPCIQDPVCKGHAGNGHGRGMCQNGSVRWALQPASPGSPRKDWQWILKHYYPAFTPVPSRCDLNGDFHIDQADVKSAIASALGTQPCSPNEDLDRSGNCNVVDVQRVIYAMVSPYSCRSK